MILTENIKLLHLDLFLADYCTYRPRSIISRFHWPVCFYNCHNVRSAGKAQSEPPGYQTEIIHIGAGTGL
jgi:hypothetical protein